MKETNDENIAPDAAENRTAGDVLPPGLAKLTSAIDTFTMWTGKGIAWMVLPMIASLVYEVVARYFSTRRPYGPEI